MSSVSEAAFQEESTYRRSSADVALYGVYEISKVLTQPVRLEKTLATVLRLLSSFLDMRHALIVLLGEEGEPEMVVGSNWSEERAKRYFGSLPEQAIGQIVVTQMPVVVQNIHEDPIFRGADKYEAMGAEDPVAFIGVPIKDRGKVVGTLTIDRDLHGPEAVQFSFDDDVRFLTMVANLIGQTVRLQRFISRDRERMFEQQRRLERVLSERGETTDETPSDPAPAGIVGESAEIQSAIRKAKIVARSNATVLLRGESGTGKELFARAIHESSRRRDKPFVTLNCAALPETVLESELFGHERGAFTGAQGQRKGRFELADGGTLFLDEIGEISPQFQAKLLRVLQIGEFERVGGAQTIKVDVRIVAATNRDLETAVAAGEFRSDLYYRISVVPLVLPPLRERPTDIPLLARAFLDRFNVENATDLSLSEQAMHVLMACSFPGNVRELENCVCRTATLSPGPLIMQDDFACNHDECLSAALGQPGRLLSAAALTSHGRSTSQFPPAPVPERAESLFPAAVPGTADADMGADEDDLGERERLIAVLESVGWVQAKAARVLGLTPRQVGYAIRKHNIAIKKF